VECFVMAQNGRQVNMIMNLRFPWNAVYFLNSCETTSFSISILLDGIIYLVSWTLCSSAARCHQYVLLTEIPIGSRSRPDFGSRGRRWQWRIGGRARNEYGGNLEPSPGKFWEHSHTSVMGAERNIWSFSNYGKIDTRRSGQRAYSQLFVTWLISVPGL
jgi:hypothetical protein